VNEKNEKPIAARDAGHTPGPWNILAGTIIEDENQREIANVPESSRLCGNPHGAFDETRATPA